MPELDWSAITAMLVDGVERAVAKLARQHRAQTFYALAIIDGYGEEEGPISPPMAAANSVEALRDMHPDADPHDFWVFTSAIARRSGSCPQPIASATSSHGSARSSRP